MEIMVVPFSWWGRPGVCALMVQDWCGCLYGLRSKVLSCHIIGTSSTQGSRILSESGSIIDLLLPKFLWLIPMLPRPMMTRIIRRWVGYRTGINDAIGWQIWIIIVVEMVRQNLPWCKV